MIAFGTAVADPEAYRRYAEPGIRRVAEPDAVVHAFASVGLLARTANLLLDAVAPLEDLETLVLVHPHCEITDPRLPATLRATLADDAVAVVGCAGASGFDGIAWWEGDVHMGHVRHRYTELGGGELPAYGWTAPGPVPAPVDAVDGFLLALSPWAVRNVRFDETLWLGHGFAVDYCRQVRAHGRTVVAADVSTVQHRALELFEDADAFTAAAIHYAQKWDDSAADDWQERALRGEAEREAARIEAYFSGIVAQARVDALQEQLDALESTPGWGLTRPLRALNARRRARAGSRPWR